MCLAPKHVEALEQVCLDLLHLTSCDKCSTSTDTIKCRTGTCNHVSVLNSASCTSNAATVRACCTQSSRENECHFDLRHLAFSERCGHLRRAGVACSRSALLVGLHD